MHFCRICRTETNLKYTSKQLRRIHKTQHKNNQFLDVTLVPTPTPPTLGNICHDCEERLHNYHVYDAVEEDNSDVDVECTDGTPFDLFIKKIQQQEENDLSCYNNERNKEQLLQLGSDGDTEIIEVLTSRENTPVSDTVASLPLATSRKNINVEKNLVSQTTPQRIVAIIDLDDEPEVTTSGPQECQVVKHNIVQKPQQGISPIVTAQKRKTCRKIYDDKPLVLVASLSLVSSDSEIEDEKIVSKETPVLKTNSCVTKSNNTNLIHKLATQSKTPPVEVITDSVSTNICVKCPVCELQFLNNQRLVHHMRCKHRSYQGDALSERSRCAQDSAMTIRLRYMQRHTYYECQLCGRIDVAFKEHKEHIMQQHAAESKSLKDPMMKELKCPVCKEKCGTQYLHLCRHLLSTHKYVEYKAHLREVTRVNSFGWNSGGSRKERNARVFQFTKKKNYFFECKLCQKVVGGVMKHLQHFNAHHEKPAQTNDKLLEKKIPKDKGVKFHKKKGYRSVRKSVSNSEAEEQLKEKKVSVHKKLNKTVKKVDLVANRAGLETATVAKEQNGKIKRHKRRLNKKTLQAALLKVKVKPLLRHFPTQKYKCRHCAQVFKGFYRLNLHLMSAHRDIEYQSCQICACAFTNVIKLRKHENMHRLTTTVKSKRKRKQLHPRQIQNNSYVIHLVDENDNTDYCNKRIKCNFGESKCGNNVQKTTVEPEQVISEGLPTWLQDLIAMNCKTTSNQKNTAVVRTDAAALQKAVVTKLTTTYQCAYCMSLFVSMQEWQAHQNIHIQRQEFPLIRRQQTL